MSNNIDLKLKGLFPVIVNMMATGDLHGHESEPVKLIELWKN
jgi:hypothetical protein